MGRWACIISVLRKKKNAYLAGQSASTREQRWNCIVSEAGLVAEGTWLLPVHVPQPNEYLRKCTSFDFPHTAPYKQSFDKGSSFPLRLHTCRVSKQFAEIGIGFDVASLWTRLVANEHLTNRNSFLIHSFSLPIPSSLPPLPPSSLL